MDNKTLATKLRRFLELKKTNRNLRAPNPEYAVLFFELDNELTFERTLEILEKAIRCDEYETPAAELPFAVELATRLGLEFHLKHEACLRNVLEVSFDEAARRLIVWISAVGGAQAAAETQRVTAEWMKTGRLVEYVVQLR